MYSAFHEQRCPPVTSRGTSVQRRSDHRRPELLPMCARRMCADEQDPTRRCPPRVSTANLRPESLGGTSTVPDTTTLVAGSDGNALESSDYVFKSFVSTFDVDLAFIAFRAAELYFLGTGPLHVTP